jgi:hypothetical protein
VQQDNPQQADVAYAAGFFDGEGSMAFYVGSGSNRKGIVFAVSVWQSELEVLDWFKKTFGGGVYRRPNAGHGKSSNKSAAEWRMTGHGAAQFLGLIQPYLKVKNLKVAEVLDRWQCRAAAETKWSGIPFTMRSDAIVRSAGTTQPAETGRNDQSLLEVEG